MDKDTKKAREKQTEIPHPFPLDMPVAALDISRGSMPVDLDLESIQKPKEDSETAIQQPKGTTIHEKPQDIQQSQSVVDTEEEDAVMMAGVAEIETRRDNVGITTDPCGIQTATTATGAATDPQMH